MNYYDDITNITMIIVMVGITNLMMAMTSKNHQFVLYYYYLLFLIEIVNNNKEAEVVKCHCLFLSHYFDFEIVIMTRRQRY